MNKLAISLVFVLCSFTECTTKNPDYIEIKHIGVEEKIIKPLFIIEENSEIDFSDTSIMLNGSDVAKLEDSDKLLIFNGDYRTLKINDKTFRDFFDFLSHYSHFSNGMDSKNLNYQIILNGKPNYLSYKQTHEFAQDVMDFLKKGGYEKDYLTSFGDFFNINW